MNTVKDKAKLSYYCEKCGSCGEVDCCDIIKCLESHLKDCKYGKIYTDYVRLLKKENQRLELELESANSEIASLL